MMLASTTTHAQGNEPNLVTNGGFEEGTADWWGKGLKSGGATTEDPAEGTQCLKISGFFAAHDKIPVTGGGAYRISLKIRTDGAPPESVYVQLSYRGEGIKPRWFGGESVTLKSRSEKALFVTGGTEGWKEFTAVVEAPPNADQMLLYLRKIQDTPGTACFDDVRVVSSTDPLTTSKGKKSAGVAANGPIITNGDFGQGSEGWWGGGVKKTGGIEPGSGSGDSASLRIAEGFACQDKRPVQGKGRYRLSMRIRTEGAPEDSVYVQLSFRGEGIKGGWYGPDKVEVGNRAEPAAFVTGGTHDWQEFSCVFEAPPTADQLLLYLRKKSGTAGEAFFDDISMSPATEAPTLAADIRRGELAKQWLAPADANAGPILEKAVAEAAKTSPAKLTLAENGVAAYRIHVGKNASVISLNAAHELAQYLGDISGGNFLPLSHDDHPLSGPLIVVGRENKLTQALCPDIPYDELGEDGFVIRTRGPHLVIAGKTPGGTMYGVNWFLDHKLGVKWLSPDYTFVPKSPTMEVASLSEKQVPRFTFRQILSTEGQQKAFAAHNLLNGSSHGASQIYPDPEIDHFDLTWQRSGLAAGFYKLMPPKKYKAKHPQWFAGGQVAMMNPEVRAFMADAIIERLRAVPDYKDVWFGFMDNDWGWDMDPASKAFAAKHGGAPSAPRLDMAIDVSKRVREALPGAKIAINAYHWSYDPPTGMTVPEDILVFPMTINVDYSTPLNKGRNENLGKAIEGWNAIAKTILLWDHITNFHGFFQPTPNIFPMGESVQWLAGLKNVFGYFAEGSWNTRGAEFASLRVWMMGRMLWDPTQDVHKVVEEYCHAYYGPAGPIIDEYIELMHRVSKQTGAPIWEKTSVDSELLNFDFILQADKLMQQAEAAVQGDDVLLKHVRQVRMNIDYVIILRSSEFQDEAKRRGIEWSVDRAARIARFEQTARDENVRMYKQGGDMKALADLMAIERHHSQPPEMVKGMSPDDWVEIQDLGINRYYPSTVIVTDEQASDGAAARLDGDKPAWAIQLKQHRVPEEGKWDIYAAVRVDANDVADEDTVLCVGSAPPMNRFTKVAYRDVKEDGYHFIKVPGGPFSNSVDGGDIAYVRGPDNAKVKHVYVDRFVMVRSAQPDATAAK